MSAGKICNRTVVTASLDEAVRTAARRMADYRVGTLVVVDWDRHPIGIVTDRDIAVRCVAADRDPDRTTIEAIMTTPVRAVPESMPIEESLAYMANAGVRRLVVTDAVGGLAGILALDDLLDLLTEEAEAIGRLVAAQTP